MGKTIADPRVVCSRTRERLAREARNEIIYLWFYPLSFDL